MFYRNVTVVDSSQLSVVDRSSSTIITGFPSTEYLFLYDRMWLDRSRE